MGILLRSAILLAVAVPAFAATGFRPVLWQIVVVAVIGSAAAQLAWRATRSRSRTVQLAVMALGVVTASGGALAFRPWRVPAEDARHLGLIVVANATPPMLTLEDLDALVPSVRAVAPVARRNEDLASEDNAWNTSVNGTTPAYFDVRDRRAASGALFTQADVDASAKVVVLGETTAKSLFGGAEPVGQTVRVRHVPFTVVAVLAPKGADDDDDLAIVPLTTFRAKIYLAGGRTFNGVFLVSGATPESIRAILRDRHRLAPGVDDDFVVRDLR